MSRYQLDQGNEVGNVIAKCFPSRWEKKSRQIYIKVRCV